ncbi:hypothetical protein [Aquicella lusitana]|uniref:Lpg0393-like VPS9-like domain-containing protein n=1 Tax=Aquicella lusitana TaxID=254246 RepID=A0A370G8T1_9COXI|nr:hypothetical protein [Aquicella lusitana]RDI40208.1 hypothetical protein C8D86_12344 [Aquicella lusitana]VVC72401.1 hypothetical protein AQULUS_01110 [Aquicella lusitana]
MPLQLSNQQPKTQDFVDALRRNDFLSFAGFAKFIHDKYQGIYGGTTFMGNDQLSDLIVYEFCQTDINMEDVKKATFVPFLFQNVEISEALGNQGINAGELDYHITNFAAIAQRVLAFKKLDKKGEIPSLKLANKSDVDSFHQNMNEVTRKLMENSRYTSLESQIASQCLFQDEKGRLIQSSQKSKTGRYIPLFEIKKDAFVNNYWLPFLAKIAFNANSNTLEKIESSLGEPTNRNFNRIFLELILKNLHLYRQQQISMTHHAAIISRSKEIEETIKLPTTYLEYLDMRETLGNDPSFSVEHALSDVWQKQHKYSCTNPDPTLLADTTHDITRKAILKAPAKTKLRDKDIYLELEKTDPKLKAQLDADFNDKILPRLKNEAKELATKQATREFEADIKKTEAEITRKLLTNLKKYIENANWKTSLFGTGIGVKFHLIGGVKKKVPSHIAKIYDLCDIALKADNNDLLSKYEDIESIAIKAGKSLSFSRFFRNKNTQEFYDLFKISREERNKLSR